MPLRGTGPNLAFGVLTSGRRLGVDVLSHEARRLFSFHANRHWRLYTLGEQKLASNIVLVRKYRWHTSQLIEGSWTRQIFEMVWVSSVRELKSNL